MRMYAKSPSVYRLAKKVLMLPSDRMLRNEKVKAFNKCNIGLQDGAIKRIFDAVQSSQTPHERIAVICIDEMTIKGGLFNHLMVSILN